MKAPGCMGGCKSVPAIIKILQAAQGEWHGVAPPGLEVLFWFSLH